MASEQTELTWETIAGVCHEIRSRPENVADNLEGAVHAAGISPTVFKRWRRDYKLARDKPRPGYDDVLLIAFFDDVTNAFVGAWISSVYEELRMARPRPAARDAFRGWLEFYGWHRPNLMAAIVKRRPLLEWQLSRELREHLKPRMARMSPEPNKPPWHERFAEAVNAWPCSIEKAIELFHLEFIKSRPIPPSPPFPADSPLARLFGVDGRQPSLTLGARGRNR